MIKLIVGLKNPGEKYAKTRHNAGAWVLNAWADEQNISWLLKKEFLGDLAEFRVDGEKVWGLLPTTYMNLSGQSVGLLTRFYRLQPEEILVLHDELDLPVGDIRIKKGGGHGGHNGLQDIINHLGSKEFYRLRVGIGHPGHKDQVSNYVLHPPSVDEKQKIVESIKNVLPWFPQIIKGDMATVMNILHRR